MFVFSEGDSIKIKSFGFVIGLHAADNIPKNNNLHSHQYGKTHPINSNILFQFVSKYCGEASIKY